MKKKLKDVRGETLIEVLVSILIGTLSISMLFGAITASGAMDKATREKDKTFYESLGDAEERTAESARKNLTVTVENTDPAIAPANVPVTFYGGDEALSYALTPTGP